MSKPAKAAGIGTDLGSLELDFSVKAQTQIAGTPFDPIQAPCAVIEFFSTWCGPCVRAIPILMKHQLENKNVPFIQISPEEPEKLKKFFKGVKVPYAVSAVARDLWDGISDVYNIQGIPHIVILVNGAAVFSGHPMDPEFEPLLKQTNAQFTPVAQAPDATQAE